VNPEITASCFGDFFPQSVDPRPLKFHFVTQDPLLQAPSLRDREAADRNRKPATGRSVSLCASDR
jgi:hypothetical protein